MDESQLINEVLELTLAVLHGDATSEEHARLERLLADDHRAIAIYLRVVDDSLTLCDAVAARENERTADALHRSPPRPAFRDAAWTSMRSVAFPRTKSIVWLAAVSAVLLLTVGAPFLVRAIRLASNHQFAAGPPTAQVVNLTNVHWPSGARRYDEWSTVKAGDELRFDSGQMSLFISNGVELLIEGPADLDFVSLERLVARQGRFAARVGPGAIGFRIDTPHAKLVDRGTSFGVSIDGDNRTDVVVYEGLVDLDAIGNRSQTHRRLESGEALSVDRRGQLSRITTVQGAEFLELPQTRFSGSPDDRVISSVSDNIRSLATAKYYRIVAGGFREECRAYVDRPHQWNGVDKQGLPPFLVGGDYVMTFNDDKIMTEIEIAVDLAQPASLYVLIDHRVAPPAWLKRDFVNTNWQVGADEAHPHCDLFTDTGAGESIDQTFSVWKRDVTQAGTVVLGALASEAPALPARDVLRSMYGIVATPLHGDP